MLNNIFPTTPFSENREMKKEAKQRVVTPSVRDPRKNNKMRTRGRHTQYVHCMVKDSYPPVFFTKVIKHHR